MDAEWGGLTVCNFIFHNPFRVSIPEIYFIEEKSLEISGYITTGNKVTDKNLLNTLRPIYATIAQMVYYHGKGATIRLENLEDSLIIYRACKKHLKNWDAVVRTVVNHPQPPLDDLRQFDEFAQALFPIASSFTHEKLDIDEHRLFGGGGMFIRRIFAEPVKQQTIDLRHDSLYDKIAKSSYSSRIKT